MNNHVEDLGGGLVIVRFSGHVGIGSQGNEHGSQMTNVINCAITQYSPTYLVIDVTDTDYQFGNWVATPALLARKRLGVGHVCVVALGETRKGISSLWELGPNQLVPLIENLEEAYRYFRLQLPLQ